MVGKPRGRDEQRDTPAPEIHAVEFECSLPLIQGSVQSHGEAGYRVTLDIPERDVEQVNILMRKKGKMLRAVISW